MVVVLGLIFRWLSQNCPVNVVWYLKPHWLVLLNAQNVRETEKFKVVLFSQENALEVKERTERSQTFDFSVS